MCLLRLSFILIVLTTLSSCVKGVNPADPYEPVNREIHKFNRAFDATMIRPPAKLYKAILPDFVRSGVNNFYENINMLPTIANDILQAEWNYMIKDIGRLLINTTLGLAGIVDVASSNTTNLPPHSNDLGITFAKWGDLDSPYIVIPFLGPSTIRDGFGAIFNVTFFTPYPYLKNDALIYSLLGVRYLDIRSQMFEVEPLVGEAIDNYSFVRDAFLQHRNYVISGGVDSEEFYIED